MRDTTKGDVMGESYTVTWTAANNSTEMTGERTAKTVLGAVRAAIRYGQYELYGEGDIWISVDGRVVRRYEAGLLAGTRRGRWIRTDRGL